MSADDVFVVSSKARPVAVLFFPGTSNLKLPSTKSLKSVVRLQNVGATFVPAEWVPATRRCSFLDSSCMFRHCCIFVPVHPWQDNHICSQNCDICQTHIRISLVICVVIVNAPARCICELRFIFVGTKQTGHGHPAEGLELNSRYQ